MRIVKEPNPAEQTARSLFRLRVPIFSVSEMSVSAMPIPDLGRTTPFGRDAVFRSGICENSDPLLRLTGILTNSATASRQPVWKTIANPPIYRSFH